MQNTGSNLKTAHYQTTRLDIRPTDVEDADHIFKVLNTPKFKQYVGDKELKTLNDAKNYILQRMIPHYLKNGYGNFTIIRSEDQVKIGICGLYDRPGLEGIDLGYAYLPEFEGQGYAFEAAKKVLELGLNVFHIERIVAITAQDNFASQRLLEKLKMKREGLVKLPDDEEELFLYSY